MSCQQCSNGQTRITCPPTMPFESGLVATTANFAGADSPTVVIPWGFAKHIRIVNLNSSALEVSFDGTTLHLRVDATNVFCHFADLYDVPSYQGDGKIRIWLRGGAVTLSHVYAER